MNKLIKKIEIKNLFGYKNISWELSDVNILVGKNGTGKSTILNILYHLLLKSGNDALKLCESATLTYAKDNTISYKNESLTPRELDFIITAVSEKIKSKNNKNKTHTELLNVLKNFDKEKNKITETYKFIEKENKKNKIKDYPVVFISTINMNANSINEVRISDGSKTTILDMEINKELAKLLNTKDDNMNKFVEVKDLLLSSLNSFLIDTNKIASFSLDYNEFQFNIIDKENSLKITQLSSGERQLVYILLKVANLSNRDSILLMDEPEISLHLSWQEKLIEVIKRISPLSQVIIVTHSPGMVMSGWMNNYIDINEIEKRD